MIFTRESSYCFSAS